MIMMKSNKTPNNDRLAPNSSQVVEGVALTPEDLNRSRDRTRVLEARQRGRRSKLLWLATCAMTMTIKGIAIQFRMPVATNQLAGP